MTRGNTGFIGRRIRTAADRKNDMMLFLYGCTDSVFATVTVDYLVGSYRVDRKEAEYALTIARQKRT